MATTLGKEMHAKKMNQTFFACSQPTLTHWSEELKDFKAMSKANQAQVLD
jgi:hypothetical protein